MQLVKTDKGRAELQGGKRTLGQRERTMLILADGKNTVQSIDSMFNGEAMQIAQQLVQNGYLQGPGGSASPAPLPNPITPTVSASISAPLSAPISAPAPRPVATVSSAPSAPASPAPSVSAAAPPAANTSDSFDGKRSMATTRMFLFDICERMFVRRDPVKAEAFREALRNARDRESMLAAAREMIAAVEEIAGHERADSIAERIAMLLPPEG